MNWAGIRASGLSPLLRPSNNCRSVAGLAKIGDRVEGVLRHRVQDRCRPGQSLSSATAESTVDMVVNFWPSPANICVLHVELQGPPGACLRKDRPDERPERSGRASPLRSAVLAEAAAALRLRVGQRFSSFARLLSCASLICRAPSTAALAAAACASATSRWAFAILCAPSSWAVGPASSSASLSCLRLVGDVDVGIGATCVLGVRDRSSSPRRPAAFAASVCCLKAGRFRLLFLDSACTALSYCQLRLVEVLLGGLRRPWP
jgi:hypothetical protein